jgi:opacity protein-like surface antigen
MKNFFFAALFALGFTAVSSAQSRGNVEFGVNVGYNYSNVSSQYNSANAGYGVNLGLAADFYLSNRFSIKAKLIYDEKGWNDGFYTDVPGSVLTDYNLNYLTVPVMVNWHFGNRNNWYFNAGPYVGFLLNASETSLNTDLKESFNESDFGLAFGIGVKVPVSDKLKLSLEYEGQVGFSEIFVADRPDRTRGTRGAFNIGLHFLLK